VFFLETEQTQPTFRGKAWSQVDARLALGTGDGRWEAAVFGTNLTNDRHLSQITAFFGLPNASVNDPRTFGVQLNYKY
jgi:iron complex outermembrane receptor protein